MNQSEHVMLSNEGAENFARFQGLKIVDSSYSIQKARYRSLAKTIKNQKYGTVGAVALDKYGNLCAGTSTGGMTNKKWGRIGDSPIIGAVHMQIIRLVQFLQRVGENFLFEGL